jgi:hypothetical protein
MLGFACPSLLDATSTSLHYSTLATQLCDEDRGSESHRFSQRFINLMLSALLDRFFEPTFYNIEDDDLADW